jgi:nucleoside-diphosphate-sugar epimerase
MAALAARGHEVHGVSRTSASIPGVTHHAADLLAPGVAAAVAADVRPAVLIHLAWATEHPGFWTSARNADWAQASASLLTAAIPHGLRRFVGAGTCAEYRWSATPGERLAETGALEPASPYGAAKLRTAQAARELCAMHGVGFLWARFFNLFGADEPATKLFRSALAGLQAGRAIEVATPSARRDFMLTADAAAVLAELALAEVTGAINVATGRSTRVDAFVREVAAAVGADPALAVPSGDPRNASPAHAVASVACLRLALPRHHSRPLPEMIADAVHASCLGSNYGQ